MVPTDTVGLSQYNETNKQYHDSGGDVQFTPQPVSKQQPAHARFPSPPLFQTQPDEFGLYRIYRELPTNNPDQQITVASVADTPTFIHESHNRDPVAGFGPTCNNPTDWFAPCPNPSVFRIMSWYYHSDSLSFNSLNELVRSVLPAPDFDKTHLQNFDAS